MASWHLRIFSRRVEAVFDQFYFSIPSRTARPDQITTVYKTFEEDVFAPHMHRQASAFLREAAMVI